MFDYVTAWQQVAKPAFESLPADIRRLVDRVSVECKDLHQLPDCSMPWPDAEDSAHSLRVAFDAIPAEWLAQASHAVYFAGHWHPGGVERVVPSDGSTWKFSHYADQVLRERLGLPARGDNGRDKSAIQYAVHEGLIRVCYSSREMWSWQEVAPATAEGYEAAQAIAAELRRRLDGKLGADRDGAAYEYFHGGMDPKPYRSFAGWQPWADIKTD